MKRLDPDIIKSPEAANMLSMVTKGFYDRSRLALWMFEAIGREYDEMAAWARSLKCEAFPQTCTWSVDMWERSFGIEPDGALPLAQRRQRLMAHKLKRPPLNPARVEAALSAITGFPVHITEHAAPYKFYVEVFADAGQAYDHRRALKELRKLKQSHMAFEFVNRAVVECALYIAPAACCIFIRARVEVKIYV